MRAGGERAPQSERDASRENGDEIGMAPGVASAPESEPVQQATAAYEVPQAAPPGHEPRAPAPPAQPEPPPEHLAQPLPEPESAPLDQAHEQTLEPVPGQAGAQTPESAPDQAHEQSPEPVPDPAPMPLEVPPPAPERPVEPVLPLSNAALGLGPPRVRTHGRHAPRSGPARVGAVLALLAVLAAIVLLVRTLVRHTSHSSTSPAPKVVRVLVPEGKTRAQIAEIAKADGLTGSYRVASRSSPLLDPRHYGAPASTRTLEGFLFPATYDANPGEPVKRLVEQQLIAFRENVGAAIAARARALHVSVYQLLTVASMVEREARVPGDRAKIAAVIYNRLARGVPLGIDATIYYAVEQRTHVATYTRELTESQLHIDSPYNTRTHTGLPPTPISNPGLASIEAAAHPAHAAYLYYVAGADGCGEQVFSTTQAAFEANVAAYDAAVKKNGGRPPSCKHGK
jgi:cell division protein YceG involved in septum cleavage